MLHALRLCLCVRAASVSAYVPQINVVSHANSGACVISFALVLSYNFMQV